MRITFFQKFFISLLLSSVLLLAGMSVLINASFKEGLQQYLNHEEIVKVEQLAQRISSYYSTSHGWNRITQSPQIWASLLQQLGEVPPPKDEQFEEGRNKLPNKFSLPKPKPSLLFIPLGLRVNLLTMDGNSLLGPPDNLTDITENNIVQRVAIMRDDQQIGWISVVQSQQVSNELAEGFLYSQSKHIFTVTTATLLLTLLVAFVLVSYLLKPLKALHEGANTVRKGDLDHQVIHQGNDEIADLVVSFNHLVTTLKQQKRVREQWLSDISHELRTPLAVLRSELEAIQDGIRQPEPSHIESLHRQVLNLTKLVDDLHTLSLSDAGITVNTLNQPVDVIDLLQHVTNSYTTRLKEKQINIELHDVEQKPVLLLADSKSLLQVFTNLLENCFRYTDKNGMVKIHVKESKAQVTILIEDSAPGVPNEALPKLFDRLYRVDKSRSRTNGGSGLGLSICQKIVVAHSGTITASHSPLGGLLITISLPKQ